MPISKEDRNINIGIRHRTAQSIADGDFQTLATEVKSMTLRLIDGRAGPEAGWGLFAAAACLATEKVAAKDAETIVGAYMAVALRTEDRNTHDQSVERILDHLKYLPKPEERKIIAEVVADGAPRNYQRDRASEMLGRQGELPPEVQARYWGRGRTSLTDPRPLNL